MSTSTKPERKVTPHPKPTKAEAKAPERKATTKPAPKATGDTAKPAHTIVPAPKPQPVQSTHAARILAAKAEQDAVLAWKKAGSKGHAAATPNIDALNAEPRSAKVSATSKRVTTASEAPRLAPGALTPLVLAALRKADGPMTGSAVGRAIGRSSGACANALARLAAVGKARVASESPRTYAAS